MATEKKMDCVILGFLSDGEATGYEIKKRIDTVLQFFWSASYGSIYPTLSELVRRGYAVSREITDGGRSKILYTITDEGRAVLSRWLMQPAERDELRSETLLKLFFGKEGGEEQAALHIRAFRAKIQSGLEELLVYEKVLRSCLHDDPAHRYYLATVTFGIKTYRAWLDWADENAEWKDVTTK